MTTTDPDTTTLERLEALLAGVRSLSEQIIGTPLAIPSTGLVPDVVDGALIETAWGNAIRDRTLERFDNLAQLNAQWPNAPVGCRALMLDTFRTYTRRATAWQPDTAGGFVTVATNASGFPAATPHDLGRTPTAVLVTNGDSASSLLMVTTRNASNFQVLARVSNTGGPVVSTTINFYWFAW
jgi:hypothetical protein